MMIYATQQRLAELLEAIELADQAQDYERRYGLILEALAVAHSLGMPAGFGYDKASGEDYDGFRAVVYILLPTGQVSWHMPEFIEWDGHTTEQKYERAGEYTRLHAACAHCGREREHPDRRHCTDCFNTVKARYIDSRCKFTRARCPHKATVAL